MMKSSRIMMHKTGDGKVFTSEKLANQHCEDKICEMFENIIKPLGLDNLKIVDRDKIVLALMKQSENIKSYLCYMDMCDE